MLSSKVILAIQSPFFNGNKASDNLNTNKKRVFFMVYFLCNQDGSDCTAPDWASFCYIRVESEARGTGGSEEIGDKSEARATPQGQIEKNREIDFRAKRRAKHVNYQLKLQDKRSENQAGYISRYSQTWVREHNLDSYHHHLRIDMSNTDDHRDKEEQEEIPDQGEKGKVRALTEEVEDNERRRAVEKVAALRAARKAELDHLLEESEKVPTVKERETEF
ncbi:hypothetical protein C8R45DRAFT_921232 [Mycena sanguinolenta]|nr:hypothetical protein C8R45DRAFT_921232 [Mycena sanguinolenta]